jgi:hypothetical protein
LASVRVTKKGDAQERETVQFMGLMSYDMILYGGWRAGAISMVNGGVPFLGVRETSVHWDVHQLGVSWFRVLIPYLVDPSVLRNGAVFDHTFHIEDLGWYREVSACSCL